MARVPGAGVLYFVAVFAIGFVLGTLRVLMLLPRMGELVAVAVELPVMLMLSWAIAGVLIRRCDVPARAGARLAMGGIALALLLLAEAALGVLGFGQSLAQHLGHYITPAGALGLAGQGVFGLIPWLRLRMSC